MKLRAKLTGWLSLTTALYHAARAFSSGISQFYLNSVGFANADLVHFYGVHSACTALLDIPLSLPISLYADTVSRKAVIFIGLILEAVSYTCYLNLAFVMTHFPGPYGYGLIYAADCLHMLSKSCLVGTLESWVLSVLPTENKQLTYRDYTHKTETLTSIFSVFSGCVGILFATHGGYHFCYWSAILTQIAVIMLFAYCAGYERSLPSAANPDSSERSITHADRMDWMAIREQARLAIRDIFSKATGWLALIGATCIATTRLLYHFWQPIFFGEIELSPKLPLPIRDRLLIFTIAMFGGHLLFNEWIKRTRQTPKRYARRGQLLIGIGALCATLLCIIQRRNGPIRFADLSLVILGAGLFAGLQGASGCLQTLQASFFARSATPSVMASTSALINMIQRLVGLALARGIKGDTGFWFQGSLFLIPAFGFSIFCFLLPFWKKAAFQGTKKTDH